MVASGPLNGLCQEVPLAELQAFVTALKHAMPNDSGEFYFYTDCLWLITSYQSGRTFCTDAMHAGAHLWRLLYKYVDDIFADETFVKLIKVKSHTAFAANLTSPEDTFRWGGHAIADEYAKQGAGMHPCDSFALDATKIAEAMVTQTALFIARMGVWRWDRYGRPAKEALPSAPPIRLHTVKPPELKGHKPCLEKLNRWRCLMCMSSAESLAALRRWPCLDQCEERVVQKHALMQTGDITFCRLCGFYSASRTRGLRQPCVPITSSSRADRLAQLLAGRHPTKRFLVGKPRSLPLCGEWMMLQKLAERFQREETDSDLDLQEADAI